MPNVNKRLQALCPMEEDAEMGDSTDSGPALCPAHSTLALGSVPGKKCKRSPEPIEEEDSDDEDAEGDDDEDGENSDTSNDDNPHSPMRYLDPGSRLARQSGHHARCLNVPIVPMR